MIVRSEPANPDAKEPYPGQRDRRVTNWVSGVSRGARGETYSVEVDFQMSRNGVVKQMRGLCSCPVGWNCKHAVSLLILELEARQHGGAPRRRPDEWKETLDSIFGETDEYLRIALAVELEEPHSFDDGAPRRAMFSPSGRWELGSRGSVRMRPVSPGRRSAWITTEVTWKKLVNSGVYSADPRQANALLDLVALQGSTAAYGFDGQWIRISDISSAALWPTLREIVDSGVQLLENKTWEPVELEPEAARADVTIREDSTGVDLLDPLESHSHHESREHPGSSEQPASHKNGLTIKAELFHSALDEGSDPVRIGHPFHGLAWRKDGTIRLARLEAPVASHWLRLSNQRDGVHVPAEDRARFEEELLPLISRVGWTSPGESYVPPPVKDATLHLAMALTPSVKTGVAPRAVLHWSWGRDSAALDVLRSGGSMLPAKMPTLSTMGPEFSQFQPILQAMENESERARKEHVRQKKRRQLIPDPRESRRNFAEEAMQLAQVGAVLSVVPTALDESPAASWAARDLALSRGISNARFPRQDCELQGIDVVRFVDDVAPRLAELGVTVDEVGEILRFHAAPTPSVQLDVGLGEGGTRDWLDLNVTMKVGDHEIPMPVLLTALTRKDEVLFLPSGEYVRLDIPELKRLRELLAEARLLNDRKRSGLRVPRVRTSWWEDLLTLDVVESASNAWFDAMKRAVIDPPKPAPIPSGLIAKLRPYQKTGFEWLAGLRRSGLGAVLADDMGLGKTVQTLAMIQDEREQSALAGAEVRRSANSSRSGSRSGAGAGAGADAGADAGERRFASPDDAALAVSGGAASVAPSGAANRSFGSEVTVQATDRATGQATGPWLVVAPTSVVANWAAEARKFTPGLRVATVDATRKRRGAELAALAHDVDILITSYTLLRLEYEDYAALRPVGMVLDEAQQAKNPASKTFSSLVKVGAPVVYAITGTPMENNLSELWAMFALVAPGLLGNAKQFRENVQKPVEKGASDAGQVLALLRRRIAPFLLRRTKRAVASELPEKQEQIIEIELAPAHRRLYDRQLQRERQRVLHLADDLDHNRVEVLSALTRLRQLSIDPALVDEGSTAPSSKLETLLPLLQEASEEGHRTLVFSQFTRYLRSIAARLAEEGIAYAYLDGSTSNRRAVIEGFAEGDAPVFLISLKAGGVGLNLTMADYVVITDPWWNPAVEEQAVDRTHRIGQTRAVHVYRLVSQNTIEEKVLALQDSKRQLIAGVLASDDVAGVSAGSGAGSGAGSDAAATGFGVSGVSAGAAGGSTDSGAVNAGVVDRSAAPVVGGAKLSAEDLRMLLS